VACMMKPRSQRVSRVHLRIVLTSSERPSARSLPKESQVAVENGFLRVGRTPSSRAEAAAALPGLMLSGSPRLR
jgi:hypothetical protein